MKEVLVTENIDLVHHICHKKFKQALDQHEYDDLAATGMYALCRAARDFDPNHGCQFSTLAYRYIYFELLKLLRDTNPGGVHMPRSAKLAGERVYSVPMGLPISHGMDNVTIEDTLLDEQDFTSAEVIEFLEKLTKREKAVCIMLINGYTQAQIAKMLGTRQGAVSRILAGVREKYHRLRGQADDMR